MPFSWKVLSLKDYEALRYNLLVNVEENGDPKEIPYIDSKGIATIGIGFNISGGPVRDEVFSRILGSKTSTISADDAYFESLRTELAKTWSSASDLQAALDDIMAARAADPDVDLADKRTTFSFANEQEIKDVFAINSQLFENIVDSKFINDPPLSIERTVLFSLAWNNPSLIGPGLKRAIEHDNHAEAFYEIRYGSNGDALNGIAKRRYYESEKFGLYKDDFPDEAELRQIYQTMTRHWLNIESYDGTYGAQVEAAKNDYNDSVRPTDEILRPAHDLLVNLYAQATDIHKIWVDYKNVDGTGSETNHLDFHLNSGGSVRDENMLFLAGEGDDYIRGGSGSDFIYGEGGHDTIIADKGADFYSGGSGVDIVDYSMQDAEALADGKPGIKIIANLATGFVDVFSVSGGDWESDSIIEIEKIVGTSGSDTFIGEAGTIGTLFDGAGEQNGTRGDKVDFSSYAANVAVNVILDGAGSDSLGGTYTLSHIEQIIGTKAGDAITGDENANWLFGHNGNDTINGSGGDDHLIGGAGNDTLEGGAGNDTYYFSLSSQNSLWVQSGLDTITDSSGNDTVSLLGGYIFDPSDFNYSASTGNLAIGSYIQITTSAEIDTVTYSDTATFSVSRLSALKSSATGGTITDTLLEGDAFSNDLVAGAGITVVRGQGGNDWLSGGIGVTLEGGSGEDYLSGAGTLNGGSDNDYMEGIAGDVIYRTSSGIDVIKDAGIDGNLIDAPAYTLWRADNGSLIIDFSGADDSAGVFASTHKVIVLNHFSGIANNKLEMINGQAVPTTNIKILTTIADDVLAGSDGDDTVVAGQGDDIVNLGAGANSFVFNTTDTGSMKIVSSVDAYTDLLVFNGFTQNDVFVIRDASIGANNLLFSYGQAYAIVEDVLSSEANSDHFNVKFGNGSALAFSAIDLTTRGSHENDVLDGNAPGFSINDIIYAGAGDDNVAGLTGDDELYGEEGDDHIDGGSGEDTIYGGSGNDTIETGSGSDLVIDSAGDDIYTLSKGDRIILGSGHNLIEFGEGSASAGDPSNTFIIQLPPNITQSDVLLRRDSEGTVTLHYGGHSTTLPAELKPVLDFAVGTDLSVDQLMLTTYGSEEDDDLLDVTYGYFDSSGAFHISSQQDDVIYGNGGDDSIVVTGGNDVVYGGDGNDAIGDLRFPQNEIFTTGTIKFYGGDGNDTLGNTTFSGELYGEAGDDELVGGNMLTSILDGGDGNDWISVGSGDSLIIGGDGDDFIFGLHDGVKTVQAGAGNDYIVVDDEANDMIDGGDGLDIISFEMLLSFSGTTQINLSANTATVLGKTYTLTNIEGAVGLQGNDTITGNSGYNFLDGGPAFISFFAGNDTLIGGAGSDTYYFGREFVASYTPPSQGGGSTGQPPIVGNDVVDDSSGNADSIEFSSYYTLDDLNFSQSGNNLVITFTGGTVTILNQFGGNKVENLSLADGTILSLDDYNNWTLGGVSGETMTATSAGQSLYSKGGNDVLFAHSGGSSLHGGLDSDTLNGDVGSDTLNGGAGDDIINGGAGDDTYLFSAGAGFDTITDTAGFDILFLFGSITLSDLVFTQIGDDLMIDIASGVMITDFYSGNTGALIEEIHFSDGSTFSLTSLLAPVAHDDAFTADQDTVITGNLMADNGNGIDTDPDGGNLSVVAGTFSTAHGTVTLLSNGDFTYTPTLEHTGYDSFEYSLQDGQGGNDTGNVSILLYSNADYFTGTSDSETFDGGEGSDTVDYSFSTQKVTIDLQNGTASGGFAQGDILISIENIIGTDIANAFDTLYGNSSVNTLLGLAGDDILEGGAGADILDGGAGKDTVRYLRSTSAVSVNLQTGVSTGGDAEGDTLLSIENIGGSAYDDVLIGDSSVNYLNGSLGNDTLDGKGGAGDILHGEHGNDTYIFTSGYAFMNESTGLDRIVFSADWQPDEVIVNGNFISFEGSMDSITVNDISLFEEFEFTGFGVMNLAALIALNPHAPDTYGDANDNTFTAAVGPEAFYGLGGTDTVSYENSSVAIFIDLVKGSGQYGLAERDTYYDIENIIGSDLQSAADTIYGNNLNNHIYGLAGNDVLEGGAGADTLDGGAGTDWARYIRSTAGVNINLETGVHTGGDAQGDTLINIERIAGSNYNDVLTGSANAEYLNGGAGNDIVNGRGGADELYGQGGADKFIIDIIDGSTDIISDFKVSENDVIDLHELFTVEYDPLQHAINDFVQITTSGNNSYLSVDSDGGGDNFVQVAAIKLVTGLNASALYESDHLILTESQL